MLSKTLLLAVLPLALATPLNPLFARESCSTPSGSGTCQSTSTCGGFSVAGYCSGGTSNQCCVTQACSTSSGSGTCKSTSSSCSGSFIAGACPGSSSIQCCVAGGGGGSTGSGGAAPINDGAIKLIESLEGFRANYYTIDGDQTIGYGHDCTQRKDCSGITPPLSQAQGETLLRKDLTDYESCVCKLPNAANLNANQYGALVSFTYNSGCGGVQKYFTTDMSNSNFAGICSSLPTTNTLNGELSSRRQKEGSFCSQATSAKSGC